MWGPLHHHPTHPRAPSVLVNARGPPSSPAAKVMLLRSAPAHHKCITFHAKGTGHVMEFWLIPPSLTSASNVSLSPAACGSRKSMRARSAAILPHDYNHKDNQMKPLIPPLTGRWLFLSHGRCLPQKGTVQPGQVAGRRSYIARTLGHHVSPVAPPYATALGSGHPGLISGVDRAFTSAGVSVRHQARRCRGEQTPHTTKNKAGVTRVG